MRPPISPPGSGTSGERGLRPDLHTGAGARARPGVASPDRRGAARRRLPAPRRRGRHRRRADDHVLVDRPGAGRGRPALADGAIARRSRDLRGSPPSRRHRTVADRQQLVHRSHRTLAVRAQADRPGAVAVHGRPVALPGRLPIHQVHRLVPALEGSPPGRDERAHAGRPRVPDDPPGARLLVRPRLAGLRGRLRDRRPRRIRRPGARAPRHREPALDRQRHPHPARHPPAARRDPRPAGGRLMASTSTASRTAGLVERAEALFPGGVNSPVRAFRSVGRPPLVIEGGEGAYVRDADGRRYLDYVGAWGPAILGHGHPAVVDAVVATARRGLAFGATNPLEIELGEAIRSAVPSMERLRFTSSGTEAVMSALRVARAATGRDLVVKFAGAYHGHADALLVDAGSGVATLAIAGSAGVPGSIAATSIVLPFNDPAAV